MADVCDQSDEKSQVLIDSGIAEASALAAQIPKGNPGECYSCGEYSLRLVLGACARCRDLYKLK